MLVVPRLFTGTEIKDTFTPVYNKHERPLKVLGIQGAQM